MADDSLPPPLPERPAPVAAAAPLAARADAATADELQRSHRLVVGSEGAYWERHLPSGTVWFSDRFLSALEAGTASDRDSLIGLIHPDDREEFTRVYNAAQEQVGSFMVELRYRHSNGDFRWVRVQGRVWPDAEGRPERVVGMVTDVHEHRLALEELVQHRERLEQMVEERTARLESALADAKRQHDEAQRANEAKSTFLAHMSHEIRTPLNGVLGLNELALREARNDQQRRYLKLALQSGRSLLEMLNGVLDFSQLNAGGAAPKRENFDLADCLAGSMRQVVPMARAKGLGMMFDYIGPVTRVIGDAQRIQQIAVNLLTNAAKYTDSGHAALTAVVQADGAGGCRADIEFRDTGPGLPEGMSEQVFEPFVQGDASLARKHGGTGLGLPIARGLAESMGGSLRVEAATTGGGVSFRLVLPLGVQPGVQPMDLRPSPGKAWLVYTRAVPAQWLATRFGRLGWASETVMGLSDAVARAAEVAAGVTEEPDLVVLAEAALDTASALGALRRHLPHTAIVLLVRPDWNQPHVEAAARASDMPLVFMPLTPAALLDLLSASGPQPAPDSSLSDLTDGAGSGADVLIAEDNPVNQLIITEMVTSLGLRPRLVENGAQAVSACKMLPPSLVLMDLQMPEMDGLEATRQLCELQRLGEVQDFPIVALTAHATPQDRERCIEAGMQGFLTKPISLALLRTELRRWIVV